MEESYKMATTTKIESGVYEMSAHGHTWHIERWEANPSLWIGFALDLHDVSVGPADTKSLIVSFITNWSK